MSTHRILERVAELAEREGLLDGAYAEVATPIGKLMVVQTPNGICRVAFEEEPRDVVLAHAADRLGPRLVRWDAGLDAVREAFEAYFEEHRLAFDLPVDLTLVRSDFRRHVLERLMEVRPGDVITYGRLAQAAGAPRAARAAGTACATNPVPLVVPCHRVLPSSGGVGNYGGGVQRKEWLLRFEGAL